MNSESRYNALLETLPTITYDEFLEKDKTEDLCFEVSDEKISDDLEDYFSEQLDYIRTKEDVECAINAAKNIIVSTKDRYKLPKGYILENVSDYLSDNFGYDGYELGYLEDMVGAEVFEECEDKINQHIRGWYTSDTIKYKLDASKEVEEYLKESMGEDYPC